MAIDNERDKKPATDFIKGSDKVDGEAAGRQGRRHLVVRVERCVCLLTAHVGAKALA